MRHSSLFAADGWVQLNRLRAAEFLDQFDMQPPPSTLPGTGWKLLALQEASAFDEDLAKSPLKSPNQTPKQPTRDPLKL